MGTKMKLLTICFCLLLVQTCAQTPTDDSDQNKLKQEALLQEIGAKSEISRSSKGELDIEQAKAKWESLQGDELINLFCRTLYPSQFLRNLDAGFASEVLVDAGDIQKMSRSELVSLDRRVREAQRRDFGFYLDAEIREPQERLAALESLKQKWRTLSGDRLMDSMYSSLRKFLVKNQSIAKSKLLKARGMADDILVKEANIEEMSRNDLFSLYDQFLESNKRDDGMTYEMGMRVGLDRSHPSSALRSKWSALSGDNLEDAFYDAFRKHLQKRRAKAQQKKPKKMGFEDRFLTSLGDINKISRMDLSELELKLQAVQHCDAALKSK